MSGQNLSGSELAVKNYLEEQIKSDGALRSVYDSSRIADCFSYITGLAKKQAVNGCAMIADSQVYKWARDYYLEELPKEKEKADSEKIKKMTEKLDEAVSSADESARKTKEVLEEADAAIKKANDTNGNFLFDF